MICSYLFEIKYNKGHIIFILSFLMRHYNISFIPNGHAFIARYLKSILQLHTYPIANVVRQPLRFTSVFSFSRAVGRGES
jgi:hypothetical protein